MTERCENCRYYGRIKGVEKKGDCRRYPPDGKCLIRIVQNDHWCGEWKGHGQGPYETYAMPCSDEVKP